MTSSLSLLLLTAVCCATALRSTTQGTAVPPMPSLVPHGRWIPKNTLGVIQILNGTYDGIAADGQLHLSIFNYMSTQENRWREAHAVFTPATGIINVTAISMYPYRHGKDKNVSGPVDKWDTICFGGHVSVSSTYPQVRWDGPCNQSAPLPPNITLEITQSFNDGASWHEYGKQFLCQQDHPQDYLGIGESLYKAKKKDEKKRGKNQHRTSPSDAKPEKKGIKRIHGAGNVTKVHVVFTQHFDLGYTDYAYCVLDHYLWYILPGVALTASEMPSYVYTTHPFILYTFFNCEELLPAMNPPPGLDFVCPSSEVRQLIQTTVMNKQLVWHSFPFDGFNEMLGTTLFDYSFNYAEWLTNKFFPGTKGPTAIQQVDVPGLYQAQVKHILNRGVRGMYVGQNSQPIWGGGLDSMPTLFQWAPLGEPADTANPLLMMVHHLSYGGIAESDAVIDTATGTALLVMCSNENRPSYTPQNIEAFLRRIHGEFPNAREVIPSTYDAFIDDVRRPGWPRRDLPTFTTDVGDTWVRSSSGDPVKIKEFLQLRREFEGCLSTGRCITNASSTMNAGYFLITGCEHNWGLPMRPSDWEAPVISYEEKRHMVTSAYHFMPSTRKEVTVPSREAIVPTEAELRRRPLSARGDNTCSIGHNDRITVHLDAVTGAIDGLTHEHTNVTGTLTTELADPQHKLLNVVYAVHNTESPTWGDPNPKEVLLMAEAVLDSFTFDLTSCTLTVKAHLNQSFFNTNIGGWTHGKAATQLPDGGIEVANSTLYIRFDVKFDVSSQEKLTINSTLQMLNLELTDVNSIYHAYFSDVYLGDSFSVQFNPKVEQTWTPNGTAPASSIKQVLPQPLRDSMPEWRIATLSQEYSPYNFHMNGTCQWHVADYVTFGVQAADAPKVRLESPDAQFYLFGWNNGQWQSKTNSATGLCEPDTSTGIWYNLWNLWNGNWCVGFPWRREDGFDKPLSFTFLFRVE